MYRQSMNLDLHLSLIFPLLFILVIIDDAAVPCQLGEGIHHLLLD